VDRKAWAWPGCGEAELARAGPVRAWPRFQPCSGVAYPPRAWRRRRPPPLKEGEGGDGHFLAPGQPPISLQAAGIIVRAPSLPGLACMP
jgi:hypothetical protein